MPIKDNNGKVIVSLLVGATAGIVTGLLLAPETGEDTRKSLAEEADKLLKSPWASKLKEALTRFAPPTGAATVHPDQQSAEALMQQGAPAAEPGDLSTPAGAGNGRSVAGNEESEFTDRRS